MAKNNNQNDKIRVYRPSSWLNIGTILFGAIFIYMIITVIIYLTAKHITSYEVVRGTISGNYRYTALALKNEQLVPADYAGYVTYYARAGARVGAGMTVCSIDENIPAGTVQDKDHELTEDEQILFHNNASSFAVNFSGASFQDVYNFKADEQGFLLQTATDADSIGAYVNQSAAPVSGFVSYMIDGMESLTEADITESVFSRTNYMAKNLRTENKVRMGDTLYKLATGEEWYLYFPLSSEMVTVMQDRQSVRFRFLKDDTTFSAGFSIITNESGSYGKIRLRNSLVRYVSDRFLEIELLMDSKAGLKIPVSSIEQKTFCAIPQEYVTVNPEHRGEITLLRETFRKDGSSSTGYLTATVYDKQNDRYLVAENLFKRGDVVLRPGTDKKHQIVDDDMAHIQGVYNINKGYAVFREVKVIDQNEEYCIVEPYNPYGLSAHDYIVLDASTVTDDDIVY